MPEGSRSPSPSPSPYGYRYKYSRVMPAPTKRYEDGGAARKDGGTRGGASTPHTAKTPPGVHPPCLGTYSKRQRDVKHSQTYEHRRGNTSGPINHEIPNLEMFLLQRVNTQQFANCKLRCGCHRIQSLSTICRDCSTFQFHHRCRGLEYLSKRGRGPESDLTPRIRWGREERNFGL